MTGPAERRLIKALSARPGQLHQAAAAWRTAAEGLGQVAAALDAGRARIEASWQGRDATAATAAFTDLAATVRSNEDRMLNAAQALETAGTGLRQARAAYQSLPPVPPVPAAPQPDDDGTVPIDREVRYLKISANRNQALDAREAAAGSAYGELVSTLEEARTVLHRAAPAPAVQHGGGGDEPVPSAPTRLPTATPGVLTGTGSGPVGAYATSTGGTRVGSAQFSSNAPHLDGDPVRGADVSVDGVVDGSVLSVGDPAASAAQVAGGAAAAPTGSTTGGAAGVIGGAGGLIGALRGGRAASSLGGAVAGATKGAVPGATVGTVRGLAGGVSGPSGSAPATPLGGSAARAGVSGGVLGGSSPGAPAAGRPGVGMSGSMPGSTVAPSPGTSTGSGSGTGTGSGAGTGSSTGAGRGAAGGGGRLAAGGPGGTTSAGSAATGVPQGGAHGAPQTSGAGAGGRMGAGDHDRDLRRRGLAFGDEDAWIDDDELGPGVIK